MHLRSIAVLGLVLSAGCPSPKGEGSSSSAPVAAKSASASPPGSAAAPPSGTTMTREVADQTVREVLGAWLRAQNEDKFDDYVKVYDASFAGIRRTPSGAEKKLTLAEWQADRKPMFDKPQRVAADGLEIETWHAGKLPAGEVEVKLTQRWQSGPNADHGPKRMRFRADKDGAFLVVAEEMVSSSKGWEDDAKVKTKEVDGSALRSPIQASLASQKGLWGHYWALRLRDAGGTVKDVPIEQTECASQGDKPRPIGKGSMLFDVDQPSCTGEHKQKLRVVTDGSGIAVKGLFIEELHVENAKRWESGWLDLVRVRLADGAKVTAE